jgi:hypothetical protein
MDKKEAWNKELDELNFTELVDWTVGTIIFGLAKGETIHNLVYRILSAFANNDILILSK